MYIHNLNDRGVFLYRLYEEARRVSPVPGVTFARELGREKRKGDYDGQS